MSNAPSTSTLQRDEASGIHTLYVGSIVAGKYRVERILGSGGMGYVISAVHTTLGQRFAIKILRTDVEHEKAEAIARFTREARAAARIQSEHVARVVDIAALDDGTPYMVMEYLEGSDLRELVLERGMLPVEEALDYVLQACEALAEAHSAGIIHRDLKPSNLFLARRANAAQVLKVLDFGISKYAPGVDDPAAGITTTNSLMGSPLYMAPEQMRSSKDVDVRADVWAMGAILYELLSATPAFGGATIPEVCIAVMSANPRPLSTFRADVPQQLQAIVTRCLSKQREGRYASMGALARDLQRFGSSRSAVHAERASAVMRAAINDATEQSHPPDRITERVPPPHMPTEMTPPSDSLPSLIRSRDSSIERQRKTKIAAVAVVIAGLAVLGIVAGRSRSVAPPPSAAAAPPPEAPMTVAAPPSTGTSDIASVPFDTLPQSARPAPRAPIAPPPAPAAPVAPVAKPAASATHHAHPPLAAPVHPKPAPEPSPSSRGDDWKWGDRN